jgi:hypothetical protein
MEKKAKRHVILLTIIALVEIVGLCGACQRTPENAAIIGKDIDLNELITQTASPEVSTSKSDQLDHWEFKQSYDSGNQLIVEAEVVNYCVSGIPVVSICEKPFQSGAELEKIVAIMYPDATVYDQSGKLTKADIESSIMYYKEMLFRAKNDLNLITGLPKSPGDTDPAFELADVYKNDPAAAADATVEDQLEAIITQLEAQLATAPEESDLALASYQFKETQDGMQVNLRVVDNGRVATFDFVNWDTGSSFYMRAPDYSSVSDYYLRNASPSQLEKDNNFLQDKRMVDQFLQSIGVNYMSLYSASAGEGVYIYEYVRETQGFMEVYTPQYLGTIALDTDGNENMNLWKTEHFYIETQDGAIVRAEWINPSMISNIDNDNVKTLSWDAIQSIFLKQMDYLLSPTPIAKSDVSEGSIFFDETTICIQRIELGLTKILMQNSGGSYKLIPTWCFIGYDYNKMQENANHTGNEICFLTINAMDGSIIDRGQMY